MKPLVVVFIRWVDAHGGSDQHRLQRALDSRPDQMQTAGILVNETEEFVTIVQDLFGTEPDYDGHQQVRHYETIPRVNIRELRRWEIPVDATDE